MCEDGRHRFEIEVLDGIEREELLREVESELAAADGLGALGVDGSEALGRADEDAELGVERVGVARR